MPVAYAGWSVSVKLRLIVFGSCPLQAPPPPVQAEAGTVSTGVCTVVEAVWVPEQAVPNPAAPHVYVKTPLVAEGPPAGVKSEETRRVMLPPPAEVVRTS